MVKPTKLKIVKLNKIEFNVVRDVCEVSSLEELKKLYKDYNLYMPIFECSGTYYLLLEDIIISCKER